MLLCQKVSPKVTEMMLWWEEKGPKKNGIYSQICVVPENIHTPPTEGIGNSWRVGCSQRLKILKKCMEFISNCQRDGGF